MIKEGHDNRITPYHLAHSTEVKGIYSNNVGGDNRFYNNIFVGNKQSTEPYGLCAYKSLKGAIYAEGNLFCNGAKPMDGKEQGLVEENFNPELTLEEREDGVYLSWKLDEQFISTLSATPVTTARLGRTKLSDYPYEMVDGTPINLNYDYFGKERSKKPLIIGPFEQCSEKKVFLKVW